MTAISVAMATYNGARFLREQLDSIATQTLLPAELVVTDDGSTDDTLAILQTFAATAPFPVRFHQNTSRLGFAGNFMHVLALCGSGLIALCDQDDVWVSHKLETLAAPFAEPDVLLSYHEAWLIDAAGARIGKAGIFPLKSRNPPLSAFPMRNPYGFSMMFRRDLLAFADLWEQSVDNLRPDRMAHDQWLFFLASALGTVAFVDEPLVGYRLHGSNTYGLDRPAQTRREHIARWIGTGAGEYVGFARAAAARADILEQVSARLDGAMHNHAEEAARRYHRLARQSARRAAIYRECSLTARAAAWLDTVRNGGYANRTRWTFGRKAALVDLSCLVLPRWALRALTAAGGNAPRF